jgi:hypothetical protein
MEDKIFELARRRVKEKRGFYLHFSVYMAVGAFFFMVNALTYYYPQEWWFFFPMLPWGAALTVHYLSVFGLPGGALSFDWEEKELRKEIRRLRAKAQRLEHLEDDDRLELRTLSKDRVNRQKPWDDKDLV